MLGKNNNFKFDKFNQDKKVKYKLYKAKKNWFVKSKTMLGKTTLALGLSLMAVTMFNGYSASANDNQPANNVTVTQTQNAKAAGQSVTNQSIPGSKSSEENKVDSSSTHNKQAASNDDNNQAKAADANKNNSNVTPGKDSSGKQSSDATTPKQPGVKASDASKVDSSAKDNNNQASITDTNQAANDTRQNKTPGNDNSSKQLSDTAKQQQGVKASDASKVDSSAKDNNNQASTTNNKQAANADAKNNKQADDTTTQHQPGETPSEQVIVPVKNPQGNVITHISVATNKLPKNYDKSTPLSFDQVKAITKDLAPSSDAKRDASAFATSGTWGTANWNLSNNNGNYSLNIGQGNIDNTHFDDNITNAIRQANSNITIDNNTKTKDNSNFQTLRNGDKPIGLWGDAPYVVDDKGNFYLGGGTISGNINRIPTLHKSGQYNNVPITNVHFTQQVYTPKDASSLFGKSINFYPSYVHDYSGLNNLDTSRSTNLDDMFGSYHDFNGNYNNLEKGIENFNVDNVQSAKNLFRDGTTYVDLSHWNLANKNNDFYKGLFNNLPDLAGIKLNNAVINDSSALPFSQAKDFNNFNGGTINLADGQAHTGTFIKNGLIDSLNGTWGSANWSLGTDANGDPQLTINGGKIDNDHFDNNINGALQLASGRVTLNGNVTDNENQTPITPNESTHTSPFGMWGSVPYYENANHNVFLGTGNLVDIPLLKNFDYRSYYLNGLAGTTQVHNLTLTRHVFAPESLFILFASQQQAEKSSFNKLYNLSYLDTSHTKYFSSMFWGNDNVSIFDVLDAIENFNTKNGVSFNDMFTRSSIYDRHLLDTDKVKVLNLRNYRYGDVNYDSRLTDFNSLEYITLGKSSYGVDTQAPFRSADNLDDTNTTTQLGGGSWVRADVFNKYFVKVPVVVHDEHGEDIYKTNVYLNRSEDNTGTKRYTLSNEDLVRNGLASATGTQQGSVTINNDTGDISNNTLHVNKIYYDNYPVNIIAKDDKGNDVKLKAYVSGYNNAITNVSPLAFSGVPYGYQIAPNNSDNNIYVKLDDNYFNNFVKGSNDPTPYTPKVTLEKAPGNSIVVYYVNQDPNNSSIVNTYDVNNKNKLVGDTLDLSNPNSSFYKSYPINSDYQFANAKDFNIDGKSSSAIVYVTKTQAAKDRDAQAAQAQQDAIARDKANALKQQEADYNNQLAALKDQNSQQMAAMQQKIDNQVAQAQKDAQAAADAAAKDKNDAVAQANAQAAQEKADELAAARQNYEQQLQQAAEQAEQDKNNSLNQQAEQAQKAAQAAADAAAKDKADAVAQANAKAAEDKANALNKAQQDYQNAVDALNNQNSQQVAAMQQKLDNQVAQAQKDAQAAADAAAKDKSDAVAQANAKAAQDKADALAQAQKNYDQQMQQAQQQAQQDKNDAIAQAQVQAAQDKADALNKAQQDYQNAMDALNNQNAQQVADMQQKLDNQVAQAQKDAQAAADAAAKDKSDAVAQAQANDAQDKANALVAAQQNYEQQLKDAQQKAQQDKDNQVAQVQAQAAQDKANALAKAQQDYQNAMDALNNQNAQQVADMQQKLDNQVAQAQKDAQAAADAA
ncbi:BspA family leucine-rich repeat surface protein, partial [Apilactobacillus timberlakei]|uniref:BspA family leucine-rich repeat surface protein n=1 Tax=Apilactobacillus timberlakei TaxID=2008380 RepID=UPI00112A8B52